MENKAQVTISIQGILVKVNRHNNEFWGKALQGGFIHGWGRHAKTLAEAELTVYGKGYVLQHEELETVISDQGSWTLAKCSARDAQTYEASEIVFYVIGSRIW